MTTLLDLPARVEGVHLIGETVGSGYRVPPSLVRRSDGQVLQLTPLLYAVLQACDGSRSHAEIAEVIGRDLGRVVSESDVRTLVDSRLRPLGLHRAADGSEPELRRTDPLIGLKPRIAVTDPRTTRRLTDPFRVLFHPLLPPLVVAGFVAVITWVFFQRGLGASAYDAFERPHLLLLVFVVSVISGGFHEFGHAAAARYSGAEPGAMGAGLYIVWPAFYTDVTDSYRLGRAGRLRTDLGGLYFNAIVVVLTYLWWWATGWEALLLLVATQVLQMGQQLLPLLRFDGYHVLADLAGVPDLYQRIRPTLVGMLPSHWNSPENRVLTRRARVVITLWVLVTVPLMVLMLVAMIAAVPRLLGSADAALSTDATHMTQAWRSGALLEGAGYGLQLLGVALPVLATAVILGRLAVRWFAGLAVWSRGSGVRRALAAGLSAVLITGLVWAWWPQPGTYRPIEPDEPGTLSALLSAAPAAPARAAADSVGALARPSLPAGEAARRRLDSGVPLVAAFEQGTSLPTKDDPVLSMVLVPNDDSTALAEPTATTSPSATTAPTTAASSIPSSAPSATPGTSPEDDAWVFPFNEPLPPEQGDNQALAVNTSDGTVTYDVAFALVWAEGNEVLNVNEAHAYASCTDCVAVAVAFQVVLIVDDAQVVVPQNLAVAANYNCHACITAAVASQLVLSVPGEPGEEQLLQLAAVWQRLLELARNITSYTLTEITEQLDGFKEEIVQILLTAPPATVTSSTMPAPFSNPPSVSTSPTPTDTGTTSSPTPTPSESTTPTPTPAPSESPIEPTESPTWSSTPSPTESSTPSPTESSTLSPSESPTSSSPTPTDSPTATASPTTS